MSIPEKNFWLNIERPIKVLAPMAGYTDSAFRLLCRGFGADVVFTELVSADAIAYGKFQVSNSEFLVKVTGKKNNSTAELLSFYEAERPLVTQLFGKYSEKFAVAAKWISENLKPDGIDINMGCPARKVVGSDHGAALLKNSKLACEIVKAVKENTSLPVSVKTRLGWENDDEILQFAPELFDAGIQAITIHGRTYKDGFSGIARWENIYKIKEMFGDKLIVIGNGDIGTRYKIQDTCLAGGQAITKQISNSKFSLDGVAIGRAAFGKPWIFCEAKNQLQVTSYKYLDFLKKTIVKHAKLVYKSKGERGIIEFRKHLLAYLKGFPEAKKARMEAVEVTNVSEIESLINNFTSSH